MKIQKNVSNLDRERGVHESIDEAEEEEDEDSIPEIVNEEYKLVEIVKPLVRVFYFHFFLISS